MRKLTLMIVMLLMPVLVVLAQDTSMPEVAAGDSAIAMLQDASGNPVGQVVVTAREDGKSAVSVVANDLPPGFHGLHVHMTASVMPARNPPSARQADT